MVATHMDAQAGDVDMLCFDVFNLGARRQGALARQLPCTTRNSEFLLKDLRDFMDL